MKINYVKAGLLSAAVSLSLLTGACAETAETESTTKESTAKEPRVPAGETEAAASDDSPKAGEDQLLKDQELADYITLVESYLEGQAFRSEKDERAKALEEMLGGHYEVTGRIGEGNRAYYLGVRREDAPQYDDFYELSTGWVDNASWEKGYHQIGYYDKEGNETILYQVTDFSVDPLEGWNSPSSMDRFCFLPLKAAEDPEFSYAFNPDGRMQLDFFKKHPGLSFHDEEAPCIDFSYQDEDTIRFWSEPYPCCIRLEERDCEALRALLDEEQVKAGSEAMSNYREAIEMSRRAEPSIRTTGAGFTLDGRTYELLGSRECPGYLLTYNGTGDMEDHVSLVYSPETFSYVIEKIKDTVGMDYGSFTDTWFETPLISATLVFPQFGGGVKTYTTQIVEDKEKLVALSRLLDQAIRGPESLSGCPYVGVLDLVREDGETLRMFVAADSCDSITYEGRIGFEYGNQEDLARIFHEAMK